MVHLGCQQRSRHPVVRRDRWLDGSDETRRRQIWGFPSSCCGAGQRKEQVGYLSDWAHTPKIAVEHSGISSGRAPCTSNESQIHV